MVKIDKDGWGWKNRKRVNVRWTEIETSFEDLIKQCRSMKKIPLSMQELMDLRINTNTYTNFSHGLWCGTGIAYKSDSTKIKIIEPKDFVWYIPLDFKKPNNGLELTPTKRYIRFNYENVKGKELDTYDFKCNEDLTKEEILNHPFWNTIVHGKKRFLENYIQRALYEKFGSNDENNRIMAVNVYNSPKKEFSNEENSELSLDRITAAFLSDNKFGSSAFCYAPLGYLKSFALIPKMYQHQGGNTSPINDKVD